MRLYTNINIQLCKTEQNIGLYETDPGRTGAMIIDVFKFQFLIVTVMTFLFYDDFIQRRAWKRVSQ